MMSCSRAGLAVLVTLASALIACSQPDCKELPEVVSLSRLSTLDKEPVPTTLQDALNALDRGLSGEEFRFFQLSSEHDVIQAHGGLDRWIQEHWGLIGHGPLYQELASRGLQTPQDMSDAIVTSFWRQLHRQPLEIAEQVTRAHLARDAARQSEQLMAQRFEESNAQTAARIRSMIMGFELLREKSPRLKLEQRASDGLRARYLVRYRDGALVGVRVPFGDTFHLQPYYLDLGARRLRPIRVAGLDEIGAAVKVGDEIWAAGEANGRPTLVRIGPGRQTVLLPRDELPQLGFDDGHLLAVYPNAIYRRDQDTWTVLYQGGALPQSGPPPRRLGSRIYFRDEGRNENGKRLWWLDLPGGTKPIAHDADLGIGWEDALSYAVGPNGDLWFTAGNTVDRSWSLVRRTVTGEYGLAVLNGGVLRDRDARPEQQQVNISAIVFTADGDLLGAGDTGLYRVTGQRIQPLVRFENTEQVIPDGLQWEWEPSDLLDLAHDRYLIAGLWGGIYLLELHESGRFTLTSVDDHIGEPMAF
jgi:uncharacterized protein DUF6794